MSQYFNTFILTKGFFIALLGSAFIYLDFLSLRLYWFQTLLALLFFYLLLKSDTKVWLWTGFFIGLFWFWWIGLSFKHYQMPWAIPFVILLVGAGYGLLFWLIAYTAQKIEIFLPATLHPLLSLILKALGLLILSYIHPFGFDWLKPELLFVNSYLGIQKWQFAVILLAVVLSLWKKNHYYLLLVLLAFKPASSNPAPVSSEIAIITTHTTVEEKWNKSLQPGQFSKIFKKIDQMIDQNKSLVILPESVFPVFINREESLLSQLTHRAKTINIITGGLYWDGKTPRNSTYIFTKEGKIQIANKVVLVPFGEANPLPDFLSDWVNELFYDGAIDYRADSTVTDYTIEGRRYRNAICFEATSEKLYEGHPKRMIVLSNNGWFTPSIEPVLQKLLLQYYSRKYGTTIYHAVNMSPSYRIYQGQVIQEQE